VFKPYRVVSAIEGKAGIVLQRELSERDSWRVVLHRSTKVNSRRLCGRVDEQSRGDPL
jgi:hypothetical protein